MTESQDDSVRRPETRVERIATACDMLVKGKRRPGCFDRSGMHSKSLSCPTASVTYFNLSSLPFRFTMFL